MTEEAYGEYLASLSLNDFTPTLGGHFCLLENLPDTDGYSRR